MRNPNTQCDICGKPLYRRPSVKAKRFCCKEHRSALYKKYPEIVKNNLDKGHGWNKGKSKANGDILIYGKSRSLETKKKISEKLSGVKKSEEHKKALSEARIKFFDKIGRAKPRGRYWADARWRRAILKRDNYTCRRCRETEYLLAHHILSVKDYPDLRFELTNGATLCLKCHNLLHKNRTRNNPL